MNKFAIATGLAVLAAGTLHAQEEPVTIRLFCITDDMVGWQRDADTGRDEFGKIEPDTERARFLLTYTGYGSGSFDGRDVIYPRRLESEVFSASLLEQISAPLLIADSTQAYDPPIEWGILYSVGGDAQPYGTFGGSDEYFILHSASAVLLDGQPSHQEGDFVWSFTEGFFGRYLARGRCENIEGGR